MKHADCPQGCTTGKSQLRFATRELLLTGFCITYHGESRESTTAWWEEAFWKGRAWRVCRVLPELHHAPWAKHTGTGRENRDPACVTSCGWSGARQVTDFFYRGKTRWDRGDSGSRCGRTRGAEQTCWLFGCVASEDTAGRWRALGCAPGLRTWDVCSAPEEFT